MRHCKGNCTSAYVCGTVCILLAMKYMHLYPITMATNSISGGNKSHARTVTSQEVVAFNYTTTLCTNTNFKARFVLLPWQRGKS